MTDAEDRALRASRFRQELMDEGLTLPAGSMGDLIVDELVSARYVRVHEGIRPAYGAILWNGEIGAASRADLSGVDADRVRALADGQRSFVGRTATDGGALTLVSATLNDEMATVTEAREQECVIVQRHDAGTITVTFENEIWVNELFTWRRRPVARSRTFELMDELELSGDRFELVLTLLEFAMHELSPRGIGATLVIPIAPGHELSDAGFTHFGEEPPFDLSARSPDDLYMLRTYLRVVDGACVFDTDGRVRRTKAKLDASERAHQTLKPVKGMRHSSARWFTYDQAAYIVIVVSADGPVSLWSDGQKMAELLEGDGEVVTTAQTIPNARDAARTERHNRECPHCHRTLELKVRVGPERTDPMECPVCGAEVEIDGIQGEVLDCRVRKHWWS